MTDSIDSFADILDVRDIIARVEHLEQLREDDAVDLGDDKDILFAEMASLEVLLSELKDNGGDEQWRGAWYPVTLIRDSYFKDYAQELAEDVGAVKVNATWPYTCIDWNQAARELQMDYTCADFNGVTYWFR